MKSHRLILVAMGSLLLAGASMAQAGTVVFSSEFNGADVTTPSDGYTTIQNGNSFNYIGTSDQWTVTNGIVSVGNIDVINGGYSPVPFPPYTDSTAQAVDLDGTTTDGSNPQGGITSESISTNVGDQYTLTFYLSGNSGGGPVSNDLNFSTQVSILGTTFSQPFLSEDETWTAETVNIDVYVSSINLEFQSITPAGFSGPTLADVNLTDDGPALSNPVPLPASALGGGLLLAGLFAAKLRCGKLA